MAESERNGYLQVMPVFLAHDDNWMISHFRFLRAILLELCSALDPALERGMARNHTLPVTLQLTILGFLATGAFQRELTDWSGLCQSSLSHAMPAVWDRIIHMSARCMKLPYDVVDQNNSKS